MHRMKLVDKLEERKKGRDKIIKGQKAVVEKNDGFDRNSNERIN